MGLMRTRNTRLPISVGAGLGALVFIERFFSNIAICVVFVRGFRLFFREEQAPPLPMFVRTQQNPYHCLSTTDKKQPSMQRLLVTPMVDFLCKIKFCEKIKNSDQSTLRDGRQYHLNRHCIHMQK